MTAVPPAAGRRYADLDEAGQVAALEPLARAAAARFGLGPAALELVVHAYNTTFRAVTPDGRTAAIRVGTGSRADRAGIRAQHAWQRALAADAGVAVPVPLAADDGQDAVALPCAAMGRDVLVTAATWLDGPDVGTPDVAVARALGELTARLHAHAEGWALPAGGRLPAFRDPLLGDADRLSGHPALDAAGAAVVAEAMARCADAVADPDAGRPHVIHADLHGGNLKWDGRHLAVFDFDDCGIAPPELDLAITAFYLRDGTPGTEEAVRAGYAAVRPLPPCDPVRFEALVASRQLLLANAFLDSPTATWQAEAVRYAQVAVARLRHWLDTGSFTRDLPG